MVDHQRRFSASRVIKQRNALEVILPKVFARSTDAALKEADRRAKETAEPDGFPPGGVMEGSGGAIGNSTQHYAILRLVSDGHVVGDVQMEAIRRIDRGFQACWDAIRDIDAAWDMIEHVTDMTKVSRPVTLSTCQACLRDDVPNVGNDRIVSGYCDACLRAWYRTNDGNGRQDRYAFEQSRRKLERVEA